MLSPTYDICVLTDRRYVNPEVKNDYIRNVLLEDNLIVEALRKQGLNVTRVSWDDPGFNWSKCKALLFRTTWDYFDRFEEFQVWLNKVNTTCRLINSSDIIYWNLDKKYLFELEELGVAIPPGRYIVKGSSDSLTDLVQSESWERIILKPAVSGAARHTYLFQKDDAANYNEIYRTLISSESMIIQEFQEKIVDKGEISLMVFGGKYSHAILKKAKAGDFRVQDDHGGTVESYEPTEEEIGFAEHVISKCPYQAVYARVDIMRDNHNNLCLGELELIEPELWFRFKPDSADMLADVIAGQLK